MAYKTAGVVVLFNPSEIVIANILTYSNSIDKLYIIDNSESPNLLLADALQKAVPHSEYTGFYQNHGIAKALNIAASRATEEGFDWLLTMDQDSQASAEMVTGLLQACKVIPKDEIGIIAPRYLQQTGKLETFKAGLQEVDIAITSGNLLNLDIFTIVGPFREDFFIDYVDHEFCLRLKLKNFKVIINNDILLHHELGDSKNHSILGCWPVIASHHNFIRRYYITRNRLAVLKDFRHYFPEYYRIQKYHNLGDLIKLILFEKDKLKKIRSVIRAYLDFKNNKFGKY